MRVFSNESITPGHARRRQLRRGAGRPAPRRLLVSTAMITRSCPLARIREEIPCLPDPHPPGGHRTRGLQVVPGITSVQPTGDHSTTSRIEVVPGPADHHPPRRHCATIGIQEEPRGTVPQPPGRHRATAGRHVEPGRPEAQPASSHRTRLLIQVEPRRTVPHPAERLSTRLLVIKPQAAVQHPSSTHVPIRTKTEHRTTDGYRLARGERPISVAVPPTPRITDPRATRRGRLRGRLRGRSGVRGRGAVHTVVMPAFWKALGAMLATPSSTVYEPPVFLAAG